MEEEIFSPPDNSGTFTEIPDDPIFDALKRPASKPIEDRTFRDHEIDIDISDPRPEKVDVFTDPVERAERISKQRDTGLTDKAASGATATVGRGIGSVIDSAIGKVAEVTVVPSEANKVLGFVADVIAGNELPQEREKRELTERLEKQNQEAWIDYLSGRNAAPLDERAKHPLVVEAIRKADQEAAEDRALAAAESLFLESKAAEIRSQLSKDREKRDHDPAKKYPCDYPWQIDKAGRKCGKRAAIVKKGGWPEGPRWDERGLPFGH